MRAAIWTLFGVAMAAALLETLAPEGEAGGLKRYLRVLCALVVLVVIVRPFVPFLRTVSGDTLGAVRAAGEDETDYTAVFYETVQTQTKTDAAAALSALLAREFGGAADNYRVDWQLTGTGALVSVRVWLSGRALLADPDEVDAYLEELLDCPAEVR